MIKKYYKASVTIETTYISVFIFFSIVFLVYFTLSTYNASVLTSNAYYILEENVTGEVNEVVEEALFNNAFEEAKFAGIFGGEIETSVKTEFNQLSIDYAYDAAEVGFVSANEWLPGGLWEYEIHTSCNRERIGESMFLMKTICDGIDSGNYVPNENLN